MRKLLIGSLLTLVAANAIALDTKELLATIAMPLAVAAVSNVTGVPQTQLANLVTTLNQANVPPTQFVEVIRYVPVALVDNNGQPFVAYVQEQATQGVTGDALLSAIVRRLESQYNVTPRLELTEPATTIVVREDYVPPVVITRVNEVRQHPHGGPPGQIKKQLGLKTGAEVVHGEMRGRQVTPQPVVVQTAPAPQAAPPSQGHGKGRGPEGAGPPGQAKEHGKGKGKD